MDERAVEVWSQAPVVFETLDRIASKPKEQLVPELVELMSAPSSAGADDAAATPPPAVGVEEFEYAVHAVVMRRLEAGEDALLCEITSFLDGLTAAVAELLTTAAAPGVPSTDTERCKQWWTSLMSVSEDVAKLLPIGQLERLVSDLEGGLVQVRSAYLKLAQQRLKEFDAKQEADAKAAEKAEAEANAAAKEDAKEGKDGKDAKPKEPPKDSKAAEAKRTEERRRCITQLGISPNGTLYLSLTSLLKQVSSRLCNSLHASLRARVVLLLENLLAMDHKAIANNQKLRTQDYIQVDDLETEADADMGIDAAKATEAPKEDAVTDGTVTIPDDGGEAAPEEKKPAAEAASSLGQDSAVDYGLYKSFWGLQEALHYPERLFERKETWTSFHKALLAVLKLFLKYPLQDNVKVPWTPPEPHPARQAPRARALRSQLDDPGFRQQFLTQVLIAFQALERDNRKDALISRQTDTTKAQLSSLKKMCGEALGELREGFPELLRHVLDREQQWVAWKSSGCREFERESLEMLHAKITPADVLPEGRETAGLTKPRLAPYLNTVLKTLKDPKWRAMPTAKPTDDEEAVKDMRAHALKRMCDEALDRLVEEDKPENGIEEEYKAKKNKVFMWQSRRLFCQQHLRTYAKMEGTVAKTDFMYFVRHVKGVAQPGTGTNGAEGNAEKEDGEDGAGPDAEMADGEGPAADAEDGAAQEGGDKAAPAEGEEKAGETEEQPADAAEPAAVEGSPSPMEQEDDPAVAADEDGDAAILAEPVGEEASPPAGASPAAASPEAVEDVEASTEPPTKKAKT